MDAATPANTYWSPGIRDLKAYVPGEQPLGEGWTKLNTNESPYPPSPRVLERIAAAVDARLRLYPDPDGNELRQTVATTFGLTPAHVFLGNGSDEVLAHAFLGLLRHEGRAILFPDVSYSFYPVYCGLYGIGYERVPLDEHFQVRLSDYARPNGGIVLPNPNAPTGIALPLADVRALLVQNRDSVVVLDEAYVDFGAQSAASLVTEFPHLLVVQTLSKSRALAGLRAAFALGAPGLIEGLERVKNSFNSYPMDRLALAGAQAALEDRAHFERITGQVMQSREWLRAQLVQLGFECLPSSANFLLARHATRRAADLMAALREHRILVRHFTQERIANHLRISIGTQAECERLVDVLHALLSPAQAVASAIQGSNEP